MKSKLYLLILLLAGFATSQKANAQCGNGRYLDSIFSYTVISNVTYSTVYSQAMDIYTPTGDTFSKRPLIILAHGGSFITGNGDRTDDPTIIQLCERFAQRGFVTVSIDYRTTGPLNMLDSASAIDEVAKAISDGKAAIRYFVKDAATTNTYKIDTNNIFIGGNSAGAVLYMQVGYIDSLGECPGYLQTVFNNNGGFEGNSGNDGYTTKFKAVINLAGGLNTSSFVSPGDVPSVNAQGDQDATVPYYCAHALSGQCPVTLCGLGALEPAYVANNIYHHSQVFPGDGHVPWSTDEGKFNIVDTLIKNFLYPFLCGPLPQGVTNVTIDAGVSVYPNPATNVINIESSVYPMSNITVYDMTGRVVSTNNTKLNKLTLNTAGYNKGIYFIKMKVENNANQNTVVKKVVIE